MRKQFGKKEHLEGQDRDRGIKLRGISMETG
jgi:hypothetical protein